MVSAATRALMIASSVASVVASKSGSRESLGSQGPGGQGPGARGGSTLTPTLSLQGRGRGRGVAVRRPCHNRGEGDSPLFAPRTSQKGTVPAAQKGTVRRPWKRLGRCRRSRCFRRSLCGRVRVLPGGLGASTAEGAGSIGPDHDEDRAFARIAIVRDFVEWQLAADGNSANQ